MRTKKDREEEQLMEIREDQVRKESIEDE